MGPAGDGQSSGRTRIQRGDAMTDKELQREHEKALVRAFLIAAGVWLAFRLVALFVGSVLGPGWEDIVRAGGGVIAAVVFAVLLVLSAHHQGLIRFFREFLAAILSLPK